MFPTFGARPLHYNIGVGCAQRAAIVMVPLVEEERRTKRRCTNHGLGIA